MFLKFAQDCKTEIQLKASRKFSVTDIIKIAKTDIKLNLSKKY